MSYYINTTVEMPFTEAVERVTGELAKEGFGILTKTDVRDTFKKKLGVEFRNYIILGACNPPIAYRVFQAEPHIGVLLPCNVVVYEIEDRIIEVAAIDPAVSMQAVNNSDLTDVAELVRAKLKAVIDRL